MDAATMRKLLLALGVVGALALGYNWFSSGTQPRLDGRITEVRTLEVEPSAAVLLVNFEVENVTNLPFVAHERWLEIVDAKGDAHQGKTVNGIDMKSLFQYFAAELGGMKDVPFVAMTTIEAGQTERGLLAARFEISKEQLDARQEIILRIVDGVRRETRIRQLSQN